jgi:DNA repair exonuclease SbcCD ATPase subunit
MINKYRTELERRKGQRDKTEELLQAQRRKLRLFNRQLKLTEEARVVIQTVARATQKELEFHISDIASLALGAIFDEPYELILDFVIRRGKTEADILFTKGGGRVSPLDASGGGAVDIAAYALRVALWSLARNRYRNTIMLDEPYKHLSTDLQARAGQVLHDISHKLNLQTIMVSHVPDLIEAADKVFKITIMKGVSKVK